MERKYESMMVIRPDLNDAEREEIFQKVIKKIESLSGRIISSSIWAKDRALAYPLQSSGAEKKKYTKGCYWLVNFVISADKLPELKETVRLEERVLRTSILKREGVKEETFAGIKS